MKKDMFRYQSFVLCESPDDGEIGSQGWSEKVYERERWISDDTCSRHGAGLSGGQPADRVVSS
jgi:hypothetical protein